MENARYVYSELARLIEARVNCLKSGNDEWYTKHEASIQQIITDHLPAGSGFDNGTEINWESSHADKLVLTTSYHHMNDGGYYDGWTEHTVTVTPSLGHGFHLRISGRNRNEIKNYIGDAFYEALSTRIEWSPDTLRFKRSN